MTSLRNRLTLLTALAGAVVFLVVAIVVYVVARHALWEEFDHGLQAEAQGLAADVEQKGDELAFEIDEPLLLNYANRDAPVYFQAWSEPDGAVVARSPLLGDADLPHAAGAFGSVSHRVLRLPDGRTGRMAIVLFRPPNSFDPEDLDESERLSPAPPMMASLALARGTESVDRTLARLTALLGGATLAGVAALVALQVAVVRRGLQPLARLETEIAALDAHNLSARLASDLMPDELVPVVAKLNDLLRRLELAFRREQAFTSDAAHELRTPLAGIRAQLDVTLGRDRSPAEYQRVLAECRTISGDMEKLVHTLLGVARLDAADAPVGRQATQLQTALEECWLPFVDAAAERRLTVDWQVDAAAYALVDPQHLRTIAGNLFENALSYCNAGGSLIVDARCQGSQARVVIDNTGSRLVAGDARRVLQPFWRGDPARAGANGHFGLGLTIVDKLVRLNDGALEVLPNRNGRFAVAICLPACTADDDASAPR